MVRPSAHLHTVVPRDVEHSRNIYSLEIRRLVEVWQLAQARDPHPRLTEKPLGPTRQIETELTPSGVADVARRVQRPRRNVDDRSWTNLDAFGADQHLEAPRQDV